MLNNTLWNNQQITEEIEKEIKICIETNENENTTTQNLWDPIVLPPTPVGAHCPRPQRGLLTADLYGQASCGTATAGRGA